MEVVGSESEDEEGRAAPRTSGRGPALGTVGAAGAGARSAHAPSLHHSSSAHALSPLRAIFEPAVRTLGRDGVCAEPAFALPFRPFPRVLRFKSDASGAGRPRSVDGGAMRPRAEAVTPCLPTAAGAWFPGRTRMCAGLRAAGGDPPMNRAG